MKVQVGDEVIVVGTHGGCGNTKCRYCFKGITLVVTAINVSDDDGYDSVGNRNICVKDINSSNNCTVDERDLKVIKRKKIENWKKRIQ